MRGVVQATRGLPPSTRARVLRVAGATRREVTPRLPVFALVLLVADNRTQDSRALLNRIAVGIDPTTRRGTTLNRRLVSTVVALQQQRLTEVAAHGYGYPVATLDWPHTRQRRRAYSTVALPARRHQRGDRDGRALCAGP